MQTKTRAILDDSPVALSLEPVIAPNEVLAHCDRGDLPAAVGHALSHGATLTTMAGLDLTPLGKDYAVEYAFSVAGSDEFLRLRAAVPADEMEYPSVTLVAPAAQWYEREARDLLGLTPAGHPDPRRLALHEGFPHGYHPLRKDVSATDKPPLDARRFDYFEVHGEGVYELPVGPIHAGIIEPGHFRFSNIGELILHLDARLFFTHRGVEKLVEGKSFEEALFTVERTCGVCTASHAVSFASAVERLASLELPQRAIWIRTLLLELERLYNHVGDIGNICAGTGFHFGTTRGAILKERLQRLNEELTGHRFLMGVVGIGGLRYDLQTVGLNRLPSGLRQLKADFENYFETLLETDSFVSRITGPGRLAPELVKALAGTGVTARASGVVTDYRIDHPQLAYSELGPEVTLESAGDVAARLRVRSREVLASFDMAINLVEGMPGGSVITALGHVPTFSSALGYSESPRGSNVHWLMAGENSTVYRMRIRSASFANWPLVARAVVGNMVPDFPLINKSFELCYACCDR